MAEYKLTAPLTVVTLEPRLWFEIVGRTRLNTVSGGGLTGCHGRKQFALLIFSERPQMLCRFHIIDVFD